MAAMCLIKTAEPQCFYHVWNELENGTIIVESTIMYPGNISENSTRLPHNCVNLSFHQRGSGNHNSPPVPGTDDVLHRYVMCYNCDRPSNYSGRFPLPDCRWTWKHSLQLGCSFSQNTPVQKHLINYNWILLNSCSTVSFIMDSSLLSEITDCDPGMDTRVF